MGVGLVGILERVLAVAGGVVDQPGDRPARLGRAVEVEGGEKAVVVGDVGPDEERAIGKYLRSTEA